MYQKCIYLSFFSLVLLLHGKFVIAKHITCDMNESEGENQTPDDINRNLYRIIK